MQDKLANEAGRGRELAFPLIVVAASSIALRNVALGPVARFRICQRGKRLRGQCGLEYESAFPRHKHIMPWRIEDELKKLDANYIQSGLWCGFAVRDGNLITGQQNFSGSETGAVVIEAVCE